MNSNDLKMIQDLSDKYTMKEILGALVDTATSQADDCSDQGLKEKAVCLTKISLTLQETANNLHPVY